MAALPLTFSSTRWKHSSQNVGGAAFPTHLEITKHTCIVSESQSRCEIRFYTISDDQLRSQQAAEPNKNEAVLQIHILRSRCRGSACMT